MICEKIPPRMLQVLQLLPDYSYREIAGIMVISVLTVKTQVRSLFEIFNVKDVKRLVVEAHRAGIINISKGKSPIEG